MLDILFKHVLSLIAIKPRMGFRNNSVKFAERLEFSYRKLNSIIPDHSFVLFMNTI